jgi:hypothetical protein
LPDILEQYGELMVMFLRTAFQGFDLSAEVDRFYVVCVVRFVRHKGHFDKLSDRAMVNVSKGKMKNEKGKMKNYFLILLGLILIFCASSFAETLPMSFLQNAFSARETGLGGCASALADSASTVYWNPAGLECLTRQEVQSTYFTDLFENKYTFASYVLPVEYGSFGFSYFGLNTDGLNVVGNTTARPVSSGSFSDSQTLMMISYGRKFQNELISGLSLKFLSRQLYNKTAQGLGVDWGMLYPWRDDVQFGLTVQNILPVQLTWSGTPTVTEKQPMGLRAGVVWRPAKYLVAFDLGWQEGNFNWQAGLEYLLSPVLAIRGGINSEYYAIGTGFKSGSFELDVSLAKFMEALLEDWQYKITLSCQLGEPKKPKDNSAGNDVLLARDKKFNLIVLAKGNSVLSEVVARKLGLELSKNNSYNVYDKDTINVLAKRAGVSLSQLQDPALLWTKARAIGSDLVILVEAAELNKQLNCKLRLYDIRKHEEYSTVVEVAIAQLSEGLKNASEQIVNTFNKEEE